MSLAGFDFGSHVQEMVALGLEPARERILEDADAGHGARLADPELIAAEARAVVGNLGS
jgi:hypothetical protein